MTRSSRYCLQRTSLDVKYQFSQLHSLHLVNIPDWAKVISNMNLKSLSVFFDEDHKYYCEEGFIPQTVTRFSTNMLFDADKFHMDLIDLDICIPSMVRLFEIIERTPNLQRLSATFVDNWFDPFDLENYPYSDLEMIATKLRPLINLKYLSFSTKHSIGPKTNERLPFDQIQLFIDQCYLKTTILKKVNLKLHYFVFNEDLWSTIVRYKNTFDRFHFYGLFIVNDKTSIIKIIPSHNNHFDYHIEECDPLHSQTCFVHIYSLPFVFDTLHGFISCSELSSRSSFLSVRYLYSTRAVLARPISFELLTTRMPNLIFIGCDVRFDHDCNIKVSHIIFDQDIFNYVSTFRFIPNCSSIECNCFTQLPQLLDQMPRLQYLITSKDPLEYVRHPLPSIKRLDCQQCNFGSIYKLPEYAPHLSMLSFRGAISSVRELSDIISSLYMRIPSLKFVSIEAYRTDYSNGLSCAKIAKEALVRVKKMDNRLRYLTLFCEHGIIEFFLESM
ncbi:unnamed protein product [Adineta steineri]|uniref:Uncharacterized protein n=1 Tax=Adineta steineri TaxID=433720 RepID=A0A814ABZ8_9BILA|nr:unnamed protein product [Adineta steineri]CAF0943327.1 unnamed protein product [Adineta steineri]